MVRERRGVGEIFPACPGQENERGGGRARFFSHIERIRAEKGPLSGRLGKSWS